MSDWNTNVIEEFRANEGKVGGHFQGAPLLLLHSTGRKTGEERVNPLMYLPDSHRWVVFGSKGGDTHDPHWLLNVEANPDATIEVDTSTFPVRATVLREGPERDALFARQVATWPQFGGYAEKTEGIRTIPVVVLERAG
jgi:deazaflavin-dependent oxidoreductase (nitroreductase family)